MDRTLGSYLIVPFFLIASHSTLSTAYPAPVDFDGSLMRWDVGLGSPAISYAVEADREEDAVVFAQAIDDAAVLWSTVPSSYFAYRKAEPDEPAQVTVHLRTTLDGSAYSAGYAIFDEYDGVKPKHCSIFVVILQGLSYNSMAKTFLHEFGHCAGLGHTLIPEAIMSYDLAANAFALDIDDQAALSRLYPVDGSEPRLPPGCAAGAATQTGLPIVLLAALLLPLACALNSTSRLGGRDGRSRKSS